METVNSAACEQAFKWLNEFKSLKSMNESHFKFFLLYIIDLHNLHIEGNVSVHANPLNPERDVEIAMKNINELKLSPGTFKEDCNRDIDNSCKISGNDEKGKTSDVILSLDDCYTVDNEGALQCKYCDGKYKREGHMKNHIETKHNLKIIMSCSCGQIFEDSTRFTRHRKNCKK